jgi:hypothetical protein
MGPPVTKDSTRPSVVPRKVVSQRRHIAAKAKCKHKQNVKRAAVNTEEKRVVVGASLRKGVNIWVLQIVEPQGTCSASNPQTVKGY